MKVGIAFTIVYKPLTEAEDVDDVNTVSLRNQLEELGYMVHLVTKHPLNDQEIEVHKENVEIHNKERKSNV